MSSLKERHGKAMDLAEQAMFADRQGNARRAAELCLQAFDEERAAVDLAKENVAPPALSVLQRSAATLAARCGKTKEAKQLVYEALDGNPPEEIAKELEELLDSMESEPSPSPFQQGVLSSEIEVQGSISFASKLIIDGKVTGDIDSPGALIVGENASINGNVHCSVVLIFGRIKGDVVARNRCELRGRAALIGNIRTSRLILEEGATFVGNSRIFSPSPSTPPPIKVKVFERERALSLARA